MGDYKNGKSLKGGDVRTVNTVNVSQNVNIDDLASAVAKAIGKIVVKGGSSGGIEEDTFDNTRSLEELAKSMVIQRGKNESNFKDLGGIKETKKDKESTNKTIDLLKNLD